MTCCKALGLALERGQTAKHGLQSAYGWWGTEDSGVLGSKLVLQLPKPKRGTETKFPEFSDVTQVTVKHCPFCGANVP